MKKNKLWDIRIAVEGSIRVEVEAPTEDKAKDLALQRKWDDVISWENDLHFLDIMQIEDISE